MAAKTKTIEVDESTASLLNDRAQAQGISVARLVADMLSATEKGADPNDVAELDRRWAKVVAGQATVANGDVVRWLETWGTPDFQPWSSK